MKALKAICLFFSLLLVFGPVAADIVGDGFWTLGLVAMGLAAIVAFLWRKDLLPHWSWIGVLFFVGIGFLFAHAHPEHTDMSVFADKLCCYGAVFAGPYGTWLLPCCHGFRSLTPIHFGLTGALVGMACVHCWKRDRPTRIIFAATLCFWLLYGLLTLCIYK